ncbi:transcriptional regulator [Lentilactobacillus curieae]|uniref:Transcriptional regulator n=1 Tax=Lentilactobacillus curieae TaxID=1138822 RepID=A0A1S6QHM0_9LACO|nr:helix-turn-helix transcriptional regulator [Lentilactobacillus curieae]AQW21100.1 transcriptional regulator [Lentilactobacillus curieae]
MKSFSNRLKLARKNCGLSQKEVAEAMNISRQSVSRWENNRSYPEINNLVQLSQLYDTSVDELLQKNGWSYLNKVTN